VFLLVGGGLRHKARAPYPVNVTSEVERLDGEASSLADALGKMREEGKTTKERRQLLADFFAKYGGVVGFARCILGKSAGTAITTALGAVALRRLLAEIERLFAEIERLLADVFAEFAEADRRAKRRERMYFAAGLLASIPIGVLINVFIR
jgi:hypothetical protein